MRPWLNWIEQQISNLWVAGSSPAGRATKFKPAFEPAFAGFNFVWCNHETRTDQSCKATTGSTMSARKRELTKFEC